jgi:hypothetical protein
MSDSPSRVRRYGLRIALLLVLVLVAGWAAWDYVEARRTAEILAAIRAAHEPMTTYDIPQTGLPGADDAGRLYLAAAALVRRPDDWRELATIRDGLDALAATWPPRSPSEADLAAVERLLEKNRQTLEMLDAGAALDFGGFPPGTDYNYRWDHLNQVGRIAALRAAVLSLGNDPDAAASSIISWLRLSRVYQGEVGAMFSGLRTVEIEKTIPALLERLHPSPESLARLDKALADYEDDTSPVRIAMTERAWLIQHYWPRYFGFAGPQAMPIGRNNEGPGFREVFARPVLRRETNERLRLFAGIVSAARMKPGLRLLAGLRGLNASDAKGRFYLGTSAEIVKIYQGYAVSLFEGIAIERSARAAIAIERFRLTHHAMPASLAEAAADAGSPLPVDPMTGDALKLVVRSDSYIVYSVGDDGKDDGGRIDRPPLPRTAAPGMSKRPAPDWGVRVRIRNES